MKLKNAFKCIFWQFLVWKKFKSNEKYSNRMFPNNLV